MGVYKRKLSKGQRFYFRGQYLNVKYCSQAIYHTKQEAQKAERVKLEEIDREARCPTKDMYLIKLLEDRLDYLKLKKSNDYYKENKGYFRKLLAFAREYFAEQPKRKAVEDVMASDISRSMIHRLLMDEAERLLDSGKGNYKVNSMLRSIKAVFNYAVSVHELTLKNPCQGIQFYPIDITLKYIPTDEEVAAVREKLTDQQKRLFDFVDETGCRIMEAIRLTAENVNGCQIVLYTRKSKNSNLTPRLIPKPECLTVPKSGRVFPEWNAYPRFLEDVVDEPKWNWHNLRHRRASFWANSDMPIFEIMMRLGHNNMSTTMKYLQLLGFTKR